MITSSHNESLDRVCSDVWRGNRSFLAAYLLPLSVFVCVCDDDDLDPPLNLLNWITCASCLISVCFSSFVFGYLLLRSLIEFLFFVHQWSQFVVFLLIVSRLICWFFNLFAFINCSFFLLTNSFQQIHVCLLWLGYQHNRLSLFLWIPPNMNEFFKDYF